MICEMTRRLFLAGILLAMTGPTALSQQAPSSAMQPAPRATAKAVSDNEAARAPASPAANATVGAADSIDPAQLIDFLNQTIRWYHQVIIQQETATAPEEQLMLYDNRRIANQVVRLAFDFARARAETIEQAQAKRAANSGAPLPQYEMLRQMQAKLDKDYQNAQAELDVDKAKLASATGVSRRTLEATVSELQGEIALLDARRDAVRSMAQFVSSSAATGKGAAGLRAQIETLAASVPNATAIAAQANKEQAPPTAPAATSNTVEADVSGIWNLTADLFSLWSKKGTVNSLIQQTDALSASSKQLRGPFVTQLRALSTKGDQLAAQADMANQSMLAQERQQLEALAAQFRQIAAAVIPLSKQSVLLNLYDKNLTNWRDVINSRYKADLTKLGIRLGFLAVLFIILFGLAELWRRAVMRYVQEPRRRHQFLLLRKFTLWLTVALILSITLAGKLGSIATFAGLLTAGVALALSNVIVAVVGYFLLIGKYGIRVGDRVQAGGVTGEVIDVGLVRFHLMELSEGGSPTGRVVAFSNAIVFQPTAGLFKQIPGTSFAWHEVTATVPRQADFTVVRKKLLDAADTVLQDYREDIAQQYRVMEKTGMLVSEKGLRPAVNLRLSSSAVEVTVRYPVNLQHAAEIDARMSRELLMTLEGESELSPVGAPQVRVKTDVSGGAR